MRWRVAGARPTARSPRATSCTSSSERFWPESKSGDEGFIEAFPLRQTGSSPPIVAGQCECSPGWDVRHVRNEAALRDAGAENAARRYTLCAIRNKINSGPGLKPQNANCKIRIRTFGFVRDAALLTPARVLDAQSIEE